MDNISLVEKIIGEEDPCFGFTDPLAWADMVEKTFKEKTDYDIDVNQKKVLTSALTYRLQKSLDKDFQGLIFNEIDGIYKVLFTNGATYYLQFSNEPTHILARTTGRPGYSCEHIDNNAWMGPFHDIALMNSTIYFMDHNWEWVGRLNIRWAETPDGEVVVGVDPNIYPMAKQFANRPQNLLKEAAYYILKENLAYTNAKTPYLYKGHSDTTTTYPDVALPFIGYNKLMDKITPRKSQNRFQYFQEKAWTDEEFEDRFNSLLED